MAEGPMTSVEDLSNPTRGFAWEENVKKSRGILNKLTPENFEKLFDELSQLIRADDTFIDTFIDELVEKTSMESKFCNLYAALCMRIDRLERELDLEELQFFSRVLCCYQYEFENRRTCMDKQKTIGIISFIGHLFNNDMVKECVIHLVLRDLLSCKADDTPRLIEDNIEYFCKLMNVIGPKVDSEAAARLVGQYVKRVEVLSARIKVKARVRFMVTDLVERRENKWAQRRSKVMDDESSIRKITGRVSNERRGSLSDGKNFHRPGGFSKPVDSANNKQSSWNKNEQVDNLVDSFGAMRTSVFAPTTILRRGMDADMLQMFGKVEVTEPQKSTRISESESGKNGNQLAIDKKVESFLSNVSSTSLTPTVNAMKALNYDRSQMTYLVFSIIKQSLPYDEFVKKQSERLLHELCAANVLDKESCLKGLLEVVEELKSLESVYNCVKSHLSYLAVRLHVNKNISFVRLFKHIVECSFDLTGKQWVDSTRPFLLILIQALSTEVGVEQSLVDVIEVIDNVQGIRKFMMGDGDTGTCEKNFCQILSDRDMYHFVPYFTARTTITGILQDSTNPITELKQTFIEQYRSTSDFAMQLLRSILASVKEEKSVDQTRLFEIINDLLQLTSKKDLTDEIKCIVDESSNVKNKFIRSFPQWFNVSDSASNG